MPIHIHHLETEYFAQSKKESLMFVVEWGLRTVNCFLYLWQSQEECEHLIEIAKPHMEKSTFVDSVTGKRKDSRYAVSSIFSIIFHSIILLLISCPLRSFRVRTSSVTFLDRWQDETVRTIEKRIADFTFLPVGMAIFKALSNIFSRLNNKLYINAKMHKLTSKCLQSMVKDFKCSTMK